MRIERFEIGKESFFTFGAAVLYIQRLRNSQPLSIPIPEPHHSFLCALAARHPSAIENFRSGIRYFTVEHACHGTLCFYLTKNDGTKMDFSYFKCLRDEE